MGFDSLPPALEQLKRVERYLQRLERQKRSSTEYDDDLWSFFQNCWHLKDWIEHDPNGGKNLKKKLEADLPNYDALMICADMAKRTKHYGLRRKRVGADISGRTTRIKVGKKSMRVVGQEVTLVLGNGSERSALDVARQAVADWYALFNKYGIPRGVA